MIERICSLRNALDVMRVEVDFADERAWTPYIDPAALPFKVIPLLFAG